MKKVRLAISALVATLVGAVAMAASPQIIASGHGNPNVSIIDINSNEIIWQYKLEKSEPCNSIYLIDGGKSVIFSTQTGAKIVSIADKKLLWEYKVATPKSNELHSVAIHKDGNFAIFESGFPAKIVEFSADYKEVGSYEFEGGGNNKHAQFRRVVVNKAGNYQISLMQKKGIFELSRTGEIVAEHKTGYSAFSSNELSNGNYIFGIGDGHAIVEYDPSTESEVEKITKFEDPEISMLYMAQVSEIGKGKYMAANWSGHNRNKPLTAPAPQLFIYNDEGKIEWMWSDGETKLGMISTFVYSKKPIYKVKK
ncbi:MAG: hypothetical protein R3Y68_05725 [Rikenellaceae bacterium]